MMGAKHAAARGDDHRMLGNEAQALQVAVRGTVIATRKQRGRRVWNPNTGVRFGWLVWPRIKLRAQTIRAVMARDAQLGCSWVLMRGRQRDDQGICVRRLDSHRPRSGGWVSGPTQWHYSC